MKDGLIICGVVLIGGYVGWHLIILILPYVGPVLLFCFRLLVICAEVALFVWFIKHIIIPIWQGK